MKKNIKNIQPLWKEIGKNIRLCRKELKLSQVQLVEKANERFPDWALDQPALSRYEKGSKCMQAFTFFRFCEILEVHSYKLCPVNAKKNTAPYEKKDCLETKQDFINSLSKHLRNFIGAKGRENSTGNDSKCSETIIKQLSFAKFHAELQTHTIDVFDEDIDIRTIYHYLEGQRNPSIDYLFLICQALKVELSELIC